MQLMSFGINGVTDVHVAGTGPKIIGSLTAGSGATLAARPSSSGKDRPPAPYDDVGDDGGMAGGVGGRRFVPMHKGNGTGSPHAGAGAVQFAPSPLSLPTEEEGRGVGQAGQKGQEEDEPDEETRRLMARAEVYERYGQLFEENQGHRALAATFYIAVGWRSRRSPICYLPLQGCSALIPCPPSGNAHRVLY